MHTLRIVLGVLIVLSLVGVGVYFILNTRDTVRITEQFEGESVKGFVLSDESGNEIRLEDIKADLRVVTFWASWSPYSKEDLPMFAKLQEAYGKEVVVVAINRDTVSQEGKNFVEGLGLRGALTFVYDSDDVYYKELGGHAMPETLFLDRKGVVRERVRGPITHAQAQTLVETILRQ